MSSAASNYNVPRLNIGIGVAALALILTALTAAKDLIQSKSTGLWMLVMSGLYGVMMFASSYVEEEQHFWYWTTSAWMAWLAYKKSVHKSPLE